MIASDYASMYSHERCRHRTPAGRQCSAVVTDQRYPYCHRHVPLQPNDSEDLSAPLTEHACQFLNAQGINYSLSALYHLLASGKISPRRAGTLAYISSLLLHSLGAIDTDQHPTAGAEDPAEKPAPVYQSEAQWALAAFTPPIVPPPAPPRINSQLRATPDPIKPSTAPPTPALQNELPVNATTEKIAARQATSASELSPPAEQHRCATKHPGTQSVPKQKSAPLQNVHGANHPDKKSRAAIVSSHQQESSSVPWSEIVRDSVLPLDAM